MKNNLVPNIGGLSFQVIAIEDQPRIEWNDGAISTTADEALATDGRGSRGNLDKDKEWLAAQLADGPRDSDALIEQARAAGISATQCSRPRRLCGSWLANSVLATPASGNGTSTLLLRTLRRIGRIGRIGFL